MIKQGRFFSEPPPLIQVLSDWHYCSSNPLSVFWSLLVDYRPPLSEFSLLALLSSVARGPRNSVLFSNGMLADDLVFFQKPVQSLASVSLDLPISATASSFLGLLK